MHQISFYKNASVEEAAEAIAALQVVSQARPHLTKSSAINWEDVKKIWADLPEDGKNALRGAGIGAGVGGVGGAISGLTDTASPNRNVLRNFMLGSLLGGGAGAGIGVGVGRLRNAEPGMGAGGVPTAAKMQETIEKSKTFLKSLKALNLPPEKEAELVKSFGAANGLKVETAADLVKEVIPPSTGDSWKEIAGRWVNEGRNAVTDKESWSGTLGTVAATEAGIGTTDAIRSSRMGSKVKALDAAHSAAKSRVDDLATLAAKAEARVANVGTGPEAQALAAAKARLAAEQAKVDSAAANSRVTGMPDRQKTTADKITARRTMGRGVASTEAATAEQAFNLAKQRAEAEAAAARAAHAEATTVLGQNAKPFTRAEARDMVTGGKGKPFGGFGFGGHGRLTGDVPRLMQRKFYYGAPIAGGLGYKGYRLADDVQDASRSEALKTVQPYLSAPLGDK